MALGYVTATKLPGHRLESEIEENSIIKELSSRTTCQDKRLGEELRFGRVT